MKVKYCISRYAIRASKQQVLYSLALVIKENMAKPSDSSQAQSNSEVITSVWAHERYQKHMFISIPEPLDPCTGTLIDEFGNGGLQSKLYSPPMHANCVYRGPLLPLVLANR